jgi:hypothetical protein
MFEVIPEVKFTPGEIAFDFAGLEEQITEWMGAYKDLEVTEDNLQERKKDIATLRKIRTAMDDRRKEIKKEYDAPLKEYEDKVKKLTGIIGVEIDRIDGEVKAFDQKRIEEKQGHIRELYEQNVGEYAEYLPLDIIKSSKWDNKTCGDNEIVSEIQTLVIKVRNDIAAIKALGSEIEDRLLSAYKASGNNLAYAIQKNSEYIETKRIAEERIKEEQARKIASEKQWDDKEQIPQEPAKGFMNEPVFCIRVTGLDNIDQLKEFLKFTGIEYEEV